VKAFLEFSNPHPQSIMIRRQSSSASCWIFLCFISSILLSIVSSSSDAGIQFLKHKQSEPGVVTMPSGLLYREVRPGTGKTPTVDSPCECHYAGTLIDGTEFDSSYKRGAPLTFAPNQVIGGEYRRLAKLSFRCKANRRGRDSIMGMWCKMDLTNAFDFWLLGWKEALQLMKEGAKWELFIPSELGYGDQGAGGLIPPKAVLIFELELLKVKGGFVTDS
jgi:FKBP-type peptidyl-prolyl cis-trans isomerase FklB